MNKKKKIFQNLKKKKKMQNSENLNKSENIRSYNKLVVFLEQITNSKSIHPSLQKNFFFVKAIKYLKQEEKDYSRSIAILKNLKEIKRGFENKKKPRKPKNLIEKKRRNIEKKIKFESNI